MAAICFGESLRLMIILQMKIDQTWTLQGFFEMSSAENDKIQYKNFYNWASDFI